ncbi:hypothetical protein BHE74_00040491 [Ensete ventricosum]|nr:hypothetical protein BHE74_00040491 [Ensete ventricosum]
MPPSPTSVSDSIKVVCSVTPYPSSCFSSISSARGSSVTAEIFKFSPSPLNLGGIVRVPGQRQAELRDCKELLDSADAVGVGRAAAEGLQDRRSEDMAERSGHGPGDAPRRVRGHQQRVEGGKTEAAVVNSTHYTSNSLAITAGMLGITEKLNWSSDLIQCSVKPFFGLDLGICSEARTC